ncbi:MAG: hypothetical protein ACE5HI_07380 [bacterium]
MDWSSLTVAVLTGVFALLGVTLGHILTLNRSQKQVIFEKRIEYVGEFLARAQINLTHVAPLKLKDEAIGQALSDAQEFSRLAKRTSFYLSTKSANAVEQYADDFFRAVWVLSQEHTVAENYFKPFRNKLDNVRNLLRAEIVPN